MNNTRKPWDELQLQSQKKLWYQKSPRVPAGWTPHAKKIPRKNTQKMWSDLCFASQKRLFLESSPRVPEGWRLPPPTRSTPYKPWNELSKMWKVRLYNEKSSRVPEGWTPPPHRKNAQPTILPFHELSRDRQLKLYRANSPRVPEGWVPKLKPISPPGVKKDWEDLAATTKLSRLASSHPSCPPAELAAFKAERALRRIQKIAETLHRRNEQDWNELSEEGRMRRHLKKNGYVPTYYKPNLEAEIGRIAIPIPEELIDLQGPEFTIALTRYLEAHPEVLKHN